ncbi:class I SAM-dependent methyltransferase [Tianweitania sediminis]|uniref:Class I SAM-dependent methyltransferase n=1 Tax=Tianweitania sediminis TaxID=1502156 RepID=A0A8J7UKQ1_9HYPH|nr:class I SAM-dependent methyltransferase [Tianweitania sediminis]
MSTRSLQAICYPSPRFDGTRIFYHWLGSVLHSDMHVLNLGAGPQTGHPLRILKGRVRQVVGADIDPIVLDNEELDAAVLIGADGTLPFPDACFDTVFSDYVLEHVEDPGRFFGEVRRVLKPGGSFFFRTPNLFHYVAIAARCTPHWFHHLVANRVRGAAKDQHAPWPTFYRANTRRRLQNLAHASGFQSCDLRMVETDPAYLSFFAPLYLLGVAYERTVNAHHALSGMRANIFGRLQ